MQEVFSFYNDGVELVLLYDKEKLYYGQRKDNNLTFDLKDENVELIKQILEKLLPSKKMLFLNNYKLNHKNFLHYYDFNSGLDHFYKEDGELPSLNDYIILNKNFNERLLYLESLVNDEEEISNNQEEKNKAFKTIIKIGKKAIIVLVVIDGLLGLNKILIKYGPPEYEAYRYQTRVKIERTIVKAGPKITVLEIEKAIQNNPYLTLEEKAFFLSYRSFFAAQLPYLDREECLENLTNLRIIYNPNSGNGLEGCWHYNGENKYAIEIFKATSFQDSNLEVLRHEFFHVFVSKDPLMEPDFKFAHPFYEFLNREMGNEFEENREIYDGHYYWLEKYFHRMARLFNVETLRQFHATPYARYLVADLIAIIPDEDLAYQLLYAFAAYNEASKAIICSDPKLLSIKSLDEWQEQYDSSAKVIDNILKRYYEVKFHDRIVANDIEILYLYDEEIALTQIKDKLQSNYSIKDLVRSTRVLEWPTYFNNQNKSNFVLGILRNWDELVLENGRVAEGYPESFYYIYYDLNTGNVKNEQIKENK